MNSVKVSDAIRAIVELTDVVEEVSKTVDLRKAGRIFVGVCPFHKKVSMNKPLDLHVIPEYQLWCCRYCGLGGDVVAFVARRDTVDTREAISLLYKGVKERIGKALTI
jgi:DNA primase